MSSPHQDLLPRVNPGRGLLFATGAAVAGALAWGVILKVTGYELSFLAWAIGFCVGSACVKGGGYGGVLAIASAVWTLLAIVSGKVFGYQMVHSQVVWELGSQMDYEETRGEAADWVAMGSNPSAAAVESFMVAHNFEGQDDPEGFRELMGPVFDAIAESDPGKEEAVRMMADALTPSLEDILALRDVEGAVFDLLFAVLGIATAFIVVMKATTEMRLAARHQARAEREAEEAAEQPAPEE